MAEVQQAPVTGPILDAQSTIPSGSTATGSGGFQASGPAAPVQVVPLGQMGLPLAPVPPPLTNTQPIATPSLVGAAPIPARVARRSGSCARPAGRGYDALPPGVAPTWGNAAAALPAPMRQATSNPPSPLYGWMQENPVLAAFLALGGALTLAYAIGSKN